MTTSEKLIKNKLGLIELAKHLGNVSDACKVMGYSRDTAHYRIIDHVIAGITVHQNGAITDHLFAIISDHLWITLALHKNNPPSVNNRSEAKFFINQLLFSNSERSDASPLRPSAELELFFRGELSFLIDSPFIFIRKAL